MTVSCKRQRAAWKLKSRSSLLSSRSRVTSDYSKPRTGEAIEAQDPQVLNVH